MNVLRLFDTSQGEVEVDKNAEYLASIPSELRKTILQRTENEVIEFLEENKNDYIKLQNITYSFAVDLYRTANYISCFDENTSDYLEATAKPIFNWLKEYGLQIHFLVANDFADFSRPLLFFRDFFAAAGLPYVSPCYFAYELMKKDGHEIEKFNLLYPKYKEEAMEICKDLIKYLSDKNQSYFFLDPNEDNDDHFALSLSYQARDGHLIAVKTSGPDDGKGSLIYSDFPRRKQ